jgi:glutamate-1-semialdehyde 2,1-aminomutase
MENLSPLGKVFHAGTLAGNPLATAAGLAALNALTDDVYMELGARARKLAAILRNASENHGIPALFPVVGTLVGMYLGSSDVNRTPTNFDEAKTTDERLYARLFHAALKAGVALAPGAYEALFVGVGHDDAVMTELERRIEIAFAECAKSSH